MERLQKQMGTANKGCVEHKIKAILFDLDGVLVESKKWHDLAFDNAIGKFGIKADSLEALSGLKTKGRLVRLGIVDSVLIKKIKEEKKQQLLLIVEKECKPNTRVIRAVMAAHQYAKIGVVTNGDYESTYKILNKLGVLDFVDAVVAACNLPEGKTKPNPSPYITMMRALHVKPENCLVIEDSAKGVIAALEAGCKVKRLRDFEELSADYLNKTIERLRIRI